MESEDEIDQDGQESAFGPETGHGGQGEPVAPSKATCRDIAINTLVTCARGMGGRGGMVRVIAAQALLRYATDEKQAEKDAGTPLHALLNLIEPAKLRAEQARRREMQ